MPANNLPFNFKLTHTSPRTQARAGYFETIHGKVETPIFMPVGTGATVKAVNQHQLIDTIQAPIILGNTYHLYLRPNTAVLQAVGGIHQFMNWHKNVLTDSGGYQVFSLAANRKITEEGVLFQSHIDGSKHLFTPEKVMGIERQIGADIIMAFDECTPYPSTYDYALKSMERTHRWLNRCQKSLAEIPLYYDYNQYLFGIVQGSVYEDLRKISCAFINDADTVGNAIGGLSVGEPEEKLYELTALCTSILNPLKPRYLMGVGTPWNILECIDLGVDMFDCVMPTRNGRNGMLFTHQGIINIKNKKWEKDFSMIDASLDNNVSNYYSKAYLRHLFVSNETLGLSIASIHNLSFYLWLVKTAREKIISTEFRSWKKSLIPLLKNRL